MTSPALPTLTSRCPLGAALLSVLGACGTASDLPIDGEGSAPCEVFEPEARVRVVTCTDPAPAGNDRLASLAGRVIDTVTGAPVPGAAARLVRDGLSTVLVADAVGEFRTVLVPGDYELSYTVRGFSPLTTTVSAAAGTQVTKYVALTPTQAVLVRGWTEPATAHAGGTVIAHAAVHNLSAATITGYLWDLTHGAGRVLEPDGEWTLVELAEAPPPADLSPILATLELTVSTSDGRTFVGEVNIPTLPPTPRPASESKR